MSKSPFNCDCGHQIGWIEDDSLVLGKGELLKEMKMPSGVLAFVCRGCEDVVFTAPYNPTKKPN